MKRKTIRNHKDFFVSSDGLHTTSDCFIVKAKKAALDGDARYGLVASKRVFKLAVDRNRAKRLMRDWIAFNEDLMLSDLDYIFIAHNCLLNCNRESGRAKVAKALDKISKSYIKNAKQ